MQSTKPNDIQEREALRAYTGALETASQSIRLEVLPALSNLGPMASAALPVLDKLSHDEPNEIIRNAFKRTADEIRNKGKTAAHSPTAGELLGLSLGQMMKAKIASAPPSPPADINQLRQEVERLRREQEALREKLKKYEKEEK
jgi:hypothetical protein